MPVSTLDLPSLVVSTNSRIAFLDCADKLLSNGGVAFSLASNLSGLRKGEGFLPAFSRSLALAPASSIQGSPLALAFSLAIAS